MSQSNIFFFGVIWVIAPALLGVYFINNPDVWECMPSAEQASRIVV